MIETVPVAGKLIRSEESAFRLNIDPTQLSAVANSFCPEIEFPHSLSFFVLDNLGNNCGVPRILVGNFGLYGLSSGLLTAPRAGGWLGAAALGYRYFTSAYKNRILEVQVRSANGDIDTGTGFFLNFDDGHSRMVTCLHNLIEQDTGKLRSIERVAANGIGCAVESGIALTRLDIAILDTSIRGLGLPNTKAKILETVYSAGYPRIYMTKPSPLLFHRGEVNGFSGDEEDATAELILSVDVAPGNSGGPIFNETGHVIGVAARRSETASVKGLASYAHAIPIDLIRSELNKGNYVQLKQWRQTA